MISKGVKECPKSEGGKHVFVHELVSPTLTYSLYACQFCGKEIEVNFE